MVEQTGVHPFADELRAAGVTVGVGNFNSNAYSVETTDKESFKAVAQKSGIAFHEDMSDLQLNTGASVVDRESYITAFNGLVVRYVAQNE